MEKLDPFPLPQKSKIRKMRVFALRTASSLILGGLGLVVPFYSVQDCNLGQSKWKIQNRPLPNPQNQRWENGAFLPFARLYA